ncbi:hypothetical protein D3C75_1262530 [compost metagenome]
MNYQVGVAFGLCDVGPVEVNAVGIEGQCGIAEQQHRSGAKVLPPLGFRHWLTLPQLGWARLAVDNVLFFRDA